MAARAADGPGPTSGGDAGAWAAEWSSAYTDYLRRASGQSASTLDLYQQVTDHIARGHLAPTAAQDMLPGFVEARGSVYADELARLNARFFSEIVRISAAYFQALSQAVAPGVAATPPPPPAFDPSDPVRWQRQLTEYTQQLTAAAAASYRAALDRVAAGELAPDEVGRVASGHLERQLPEFLGELGELWFELLNGLNELRAGSETEFLTGVLERANGAGGEQPFALTLSAPLGESATVSVSIANTREERARIRCDLSDVRRADGVGPAFAPAASIVPEGLELAPGEEAALTMTVRLEEGDYEPGALYVGTLTVSGHGEPRLEVPLRITATEPTVAPPP